MLPVFESKRLVILPWISEIDESPKMRNYDKCHLQCWYENQIARIQEENNINSSKKYSHGTGFWAILEKKSQQLVGGVLIGELYDINQKVTPNYEISWQIYQEYSSQGYATETVSRIIKYGLKTLKLPALIAIIDPNNTTSLKIATKVGMTSLGTTDNYYSRGQELFYIKAECEHFL